MAVSLLFTPRFSSGVCSPRFTATPAWSPQGRPEGSGHSPRPGAGPAKASPQRVVRRGRHSVPPGAVAILPAIPSLSLVLAGVLVLLAVLTAPERPLDQAAICQRHAGPEACRVW